MTEHTATGSNRIEIIELAQQIMDIANISYYYCKFSEIVSSENVQINMQK